MDLTTVILMLLAGLAHASWHAIVKSQSRHATLAGMGVIASLVALPFAFVFELPAVTTLPILAVSVLMHSGYKVCLAFAYERSDLSKAYPLARGAVPIFATVLSLVALRQVPQPMQFAGIGIVSLGLFGLALEKFEANGRILLAAFGAGAMVAGYSVLDAYGTQIPPGWASFTIWVILLDSMLFLGIARAIRGKELWSELHAGRARVICAGVLGTISFSIFMWALSRNPAAVVVAFRECSVLFATLIGLLWLKEAVSMRRILSAVSIAIGLMLVALYPR